MPARAVGSLARSQATVIAAGAGGSVDRLPPRPLHLGRVDDLGQVEQGARSRCGRDAGSAVRSSGWSRHAVKANQAPAGPAAKAGHVDRAPLSCEGPRAQRH